MICGSSRLKGIRVELSMVYAYSDKPELLDCFIRKTIIPMTEGIKENSGSANDERRSMKKGIEKFHQTAKPGETFCYTFFKGRGMK
ncbi:hypothetical protein ACSAZL_16710 [Methanosarcina sp. T3]|uniref:hypothetical protein n=1 Tax=Methanosarcina sp. T3 TaxID=3439062 RepID=UPI003F8422B4